MQDNQLMPWKDDAQARQANVTLGGEVISFPVVPGAIAQELRDQCDIKKPHRQAILRKTQKQFKALHKGKEAHTAQQSEAYLFSAFILWIDSLIAGRHLQIRDGALDAEALAKETFEALA